MKSRITAMLAAWTFASCGKETYEMNSPVSGEGQVTVSFTDEPNATPAAFFRSELDDRGMRKIAVAPFGILLRRGRPVDRKARLHFLGSRSQKGDFRPS